MCEKILDRIKKWTDIVQGVAETHTYLSQIYINNGHNAYMKYFGNFEYPQWLSKIPLNLSLFTVRYVGKANEEIDLLY